MIKFPSLRVSSVRVSMLDQCTFSPSVIILRLMMENENYLLHILALHASLPSNWKYIASFEGIALELKSLRQYMYCFFYFAQYIQSPGEVTLIFSLIRRLGPFFGVQNSELQYFWGVFRKTNIFWGMKFLWIFFEVITKLG